MVYFPSHSLSVPRPDVTVSAAMRELVSGSSLSLSCSIQPLSVDTSTTITSNWTTPGGRHDTVNGDSDTSPELVISSVETADSGVYTCSVIVTDSTGSQFILDSPLTVSIINITISKLKKVKEIVCFKHCYNLGICAELKVRVSAIYRPSPGEVPGELGPNDFTAGSDLTLRCSVEGHSGGLSYSWSVSGNPSTPPGCGSYCDIDTTSNTAVMSMGSSSTLVVGRPPLLSYYAGMYICTAIEPDRPGSRNSDDFSVSVVGEFIILYIYIRRG